MHDMVILRGKDNALEPGNHIATLLSSVFDLKFDKEHLHPMDRSRG